MGLLKSRTTARTNTWYAAGLRFECVQCGHCCSGDPGYVWVNRETIGRIAAFLGVRAALIPRNPDAEDDPKAALVNLARRSRWRMVREDMVPREGSGGRVGPVYAGRLIEFVAAGERSWRPDVAARRSDSLRRCVEALRTLRERNQERD